VRLSFPARANGGSGSRRSLFAYAFAALALIGAAQAASAAWIPAKAMLAQVLLERAFDASRLSGQPEKPWPWADTAPLARIAVPRLHERTIVLSGASGEAMAFGPTKLATDPASGVTVLAAHRDTHFAFIQRLRQGDIVTSEGIDGAHARYRIEGFATVRWDRFAVPRSRHGEWLALTTCYPFDGASRSPLRRIAWARRVA
jgi:sortase A